MKVDEALSLLGLSDGPHKPIEVDRAYFKSLKNEAAGTKLKGTNPNNSGASPSSSMNTASASEAVEVWDTLVFGWERLSEWEVSKFCVKELCSIRAWRLMKNRAKEYAAVVDADFPNRIQYEWSEEEAFGDIDALLELGHLRASETDELVSDTIMRSRIARARFRALYINPTLIWIEGTYLEGRNGKKLYSCTADEIDCELHDPKLDDGDNCFTFKEGASKDYYRLRFPFDVERRLFLISDMYGQCGIVNALRLVVLHAGIGFDSFGRILGSSLASLELSCDDVCRIAESIMDRQLGCSGLPFGKPHLEGISINGQRCMPICMIPKRQREELMGEGSALKDRFNDEEGLCNALVELWAEGRRSQPFEASVESPEDIAENMIRAICELDGEVPKGLRIGNEALSPAGEAHDCLMREPWRMLPIGSFEERKNVVEEFDDYKCSKRKHGEAYDQWRSKHFASTFDLIKSALSDFKEAALLVILVFGGFGAYVVFALSGGNIFIFSAQYFYSLIAAAIVVGFLAPAWELLSWPINLWWDRKIKRAPKRIRWAFELQTLCKGFIAAAIGIFAGLLVLALFVIASRAYPLASTGAIRATAIASGAISFFGYMIHQRPGN